MIRNDIEAFARLLEANGFSGATQLIVNDLLPIAKKHEISLLAAAERYANCDEDQDTSFFQLGRILLKIGDEELGRLDIHEPLKKGKGYVKKSRHD
jgi:hypothetical protein